MKKLMLICAPVTSRSGYGAHARDLVWSFLQNKDLDIKVMDVRWGDCPQNALELDNPKHFLISQHMLNNPQLPKKPDIYVDVRIPNEFETHGEFNIGITAGMETNAISQKWIEGCNKMDLIIVPSEHSKAGIVHTVYDKMQDMPNNQKQKIGELKVVKPVEVLFEGADLDIYKPLTKDEIDEDFFDMLNEKVPEKFAFLSVGQWTKGGYGEDRKDLAKTIKIFYEAFANKKKQPALILKTSGATYSLIDREECLRKINEVKSMFPSDWKLPNVYLLHGALSDKEMNYLYNHPKVKAMVSFTHGEGFGRPLLEATITGLPVVASGWSGHVDFLDRFTNLLIPGSVDKVPKSAVWTDIIVEESGWFNVDEKVAYKALQDMFNQNETYKRKSKQLMFKNREVFTLEEMKNKLTFIVNQYSPKEVSLTLPKLKKSNTETNKKIELPKLKKLTSADGAIV